MDYQPNCSGTGFFFKFSIHFRVIIDISVLFCLYIFVFELLPFFPTVRIIGENHLLSSFFCNAVSQLKLLRIMSESHKIRKKLNCLFDRALHCESSPIYSRSKQAQNRITVIRSVYGTNGDLYKGTIYTHKCPKAHLAQARKHRMAFMCVKMTIWENKA